MNSRTFDRLEWTLGILLTAAILVLLIARASHAGGLWRDECACVQLANLPTVKGVLQNFQRESFPAAFPLTIRAFSALFGTTDAAYRTFGAVVGLLLLVAIWTNALLLTRTPPLLALALLGFNLTFLIWGTTIRGYGLGTAFIVLAFGLIPWMSLQPNRWRIFAAAAVSLGSVQFLLYNSVLLAAFAFGVVAIGFARKHWAALPPTLLVLTAAAISVLPYLPAFWHEHFFTIVFQRELSVAWIWSKLEPAFGRPARVMAVVWGALILAAVVGAIVRLRRSRSRPATPEDSLLLYAVVALLVGIAVYFCFLIVVAYGTQEWYYLALLAVIAVAVELIFTLLSSNQWIRGARLLLAAVALVAMPLLDWAPVVQRQTNLDLIAKKMVELAGPRDLIVVNPWFYGVGFNWYYHGQTHWETVPPMNDHNVHRFDLLKASMASPDPIADLREQIAETLRSQHRVWFIGGLKLLESGQVPGTLPPAPHSQYGWNCDIYDELWSRQLAGFVQLHASDLYVDVAEEGKYNSLEDVGVIIAEGWEED